MNLSNKIFRNAYYSWIIIIPAKIVLSSFVKLGLLSTRERIFKYSSDDSINGNIKRFQGLLDLLKQSKKFRSFSGLDIVEIGSGGSIINGLAFTMLGAKSYYGIDVDHTPTLNSKETDKAISLLNEKLCLNERNCHILDNISYSNLGTSSLRNFKKNSIDLIYSNSVLEHIRLNELQDNLEHQYRILKKGGIAVHRVDLKDHLGGGLNNLRFSEKFWESDFISSSGFYTNRVRFSTFLDLLKSIGYKVDFIEYSKFTNLPLKYIYMAKIFKNLPDLDVRHFDIILEK
jgi:SAM-dependent methyltransferase